MLWQYDYVNNLHNYVALYSILTDASFYPEEGLYDVGIMAITPMTSDVVETIPKLFDISPYPTTDILQFDFWEVIQYSSR